MNRKASSAGIKRLFSLYSTSLLLSLPQPERIGGEEEVHTRHTLCAQMKFWSAHVVTALKYVDLCVCLYVSAYLHR